MSALQPPKPPSPFPPGGTYIIPNYGDFTAKMMPTGTQNIDEMLEPVTWEEVQDAPKAKSYRNQLLGGAVVIAGCLAFIGGLALMGYYGSSWFILIALLGGLLVSLVLMAFFMVSPRAIAVTSSAMYLRYGKKKVNIFMWEEVENVCRVLVRAPSGTRTYSYPFTSRRMFFIITKGGIHWHWPIESPPPPKLMRIAREGFEDFYRERYNKAPPPADIPPIGTPTVNKPGIF
jgi:hypothetical protein